MDKKRTFLDQESFDYFFVALVKYIDLTLVATLRSTMEYLLGLTIYKNLSVSDYEYFIQNILMYIFSDFHFLIYQNLL